MELLLLLLTAHFISDFYLQPAHWLTYRNSHHIKSLGFWQHVAVHTLLNIVVFLISDIALLPAIIAIVLISLAHVLTNHWLSYRSNKLSFVLTTQSFHLLLICIIWAYLANFTIEQVTSFISSFLSAKNLIIAISYLLVCKPASVIISLALKKHTDSLTQHSNGSTENTTIEENENIGLVSAGAWIGYIERCLAISFIFMGQFAGIGFLVATKTIFRFGDLTKNKDMKLTEYMMLGTLLSYAIALFIGWNVLQIYKVL
jgi:hypothetical protein